jgi:hypothetical protein
MVNELLLKMNCTIILKHVVNRENKSNTNKFSVAIAGLFERYTYTKRNRMHPTRIKSGTFPDPDVISEQRFSFPRRLCSHSLSWNCSVMAERA